VSNDVFISDAELVSKFINDNIVWQDLLSILYERLEAFHIALENDSISIDMIRHMQGAVSEIRQLINMPEVLLEALNEKETIDGRNA